MLKMIARLLHAPFDFFQLKLLFFQKDKRLVDIVKLVKREVKKEGDGETSFFNTEAFQILCCAIAARKLSGDYAEVGVFKGASAKLICEVKGNHSLFLFDTFEGLPEPGIFDKKLKSKRFASDLEWVKKYLNSYQSVYFYKGMFPETARGIEDKTFAFVHLDVDFYQSTLDGLKFFYPRLVRGGMILTHDYPHLSGVKRAFDEFFIDKPEAIIELSTCQALIVKQ